MSEQRSNPFISGCLGTLGAVAALVLLCGGGCIFFFGAPAFKKGYDDARKNAAARDAAAKTNAPPSEKSDQSDKK